MNVFKQYFEYINDNPQHYWFKRKLYGWGWTPATWQGWVVLLVFIVAIAKRFILLDANSHSASDTLRPLIIETFFLTVALIAICYKKGEPPKWQWGIPKKKK